MKRPVAVSLPPRESQGEGATDSFEGGINRVFTTDETSVITTNRVDRFPLYVVAQAQSGEVEGLCSFVRGVQGVVPSLSFECLHFLLGGARPFAIFADPSKNGTCITCLGVFPEYAGGGKVRYR